MSNETEWLKAGAKAVILQDQDRGALRAEEVTIERVLKRDVVLSNGERFNRNFLTRQTGAWGPTVRLVSVDHPDVAATRQKVRHRFAVNAAHGAFDLWRRTKSTEDARQVVEKFEQLLRVEDGAR